MLCVFTKFVSLGERWRSLNPTMGFALLVKFVVDTKYHDCFRHQTTMLMKHLWCKYLSSLKDLWAIAGSCATDSV